MFFRKPLTTIALIASTLQAYGSGNGADPEMGHDIVSSAQKCVAVHKRTGNQVALVPEGKCNRIGFTRKLIEGSIKDYGFFYEYSRDEMYFDSDAELFTHISKLAVEAANKIVENLIQGDLIKKAGVKIINGNVDADGNVVTEISQLDDQDTVSYSLFYKMGQIQDKNRVPTETEMIKGSRKIDTKVIPNARVVYVPTEIMGDIERLKDFHNEPAFVGVEHYAAAGNILKGEAGKVGRHRIIPVLEMQDAGAGKDGASDEFYKTSDGKYRVFPILSVGKDSFYTITFHADKVGKTKFNIISKKPGLETADRHDPYGRVGFWSCQFHYGSLIKRPERITVAYVTAKI